MSKKTLAEINKHNDALSVLSSADRVNRARSVAVGAVVGGDTEIVMRGDGRYLWMVLQQKEVVEFIHQLASSVGCHIHIQPRNDFASWREWRETPRDSIGPASSPIAESTQGSLMLQDQQLKIKPSHIDPETQNEQPVAIEKTIKRRSTKRTATTA